MTIPRRPSVSGAPGGERGGDADQAEKQEPRILKAVFQRRNPEEQALRRNTIAELVKLANEAPTGTNLGARMRRPDSSLPPVSTGSSAPTAPPSEGPLRFSSGFECGNLLCAKLVCPAGAGKGGGSSSSSASPAQASELPTELEYDLYLDNDTQASQSHMQWFYFRVNSGDFQGTVHFRIVNMKKKKSLYQQGFQPHVYSVRRNKGWEPEACEGCSYVANAGRPKASDVKSDQNTLSFSYSIDFRDDDIFFAAYPPYTYSMLQDFLGRLESTEEARRHFVSAELCKSIGQLPVPHLVISEDIGLPDAAKANPATATLRPSVAVIARQHPGEVVGSWAAQGFIRFLLGQTPAAVRMRHHFVFHVIPMVNVDGVVHGNSRCTLVGTDPNRVWHDPNPIIHPVIYALKAFLRSLAQGADVLGGPCKGLELFLDFHGHSAKFGCFFYGSNAASGHISNALLPKLCAVCNRDISFEQCHWRCSRSHKKTARYVVNKQLGVKYAYTIECSLAGAVPQGSSKGYGSVVSVAAMLLGAESRSMVDVARYGDEAEDVIDNGIFTTSRVEWIGCSVGRATATFLHRDGDPRPTPASSFIPSSVEFVSPPPPVEPVPRLTDVPPVPDGEGPSLLSGACSEKDTETASYVRGISHESEVDEEEDEDEEEDDEDSRPGSRRSSKTGRHRASSVVHGIDCGCSETDWLPDMSCPKVMARKPWITLADLESRTAQEVLENLIAVYGDTVPDHRALNKDGSDDGGDSDGDQDEPPEPPEAAAEDKEGKEGAEKEGEKKAVASSKGDETPGPASPKEPVSSRKKNKDAAREASGAKTSREPVAPSRPAGAPPAASQGRSAALVASRCRGGAPVTSRGQQQPEKACSATSASLSSSGRATSPMRAAGCSSKERAGSVEPASDIAAPGEAASTSPDKERTPRPASKAGSERPQQHAPRIGSKDRQPPAEAIRLPVQSFAMEDPREWASCSPAGSPSLSPTPPPEPNTSSRFPTKGRVLTERRGSPSPSPGPGRRRSDAPLPAGGGAPPQAQAKVAASSNVPLGGSAPLASGSSSGWRAAAGAPAAASVAMSASSVLEDVLAQAVAASGEPPAAIAGGGLQVMGCNAGGQSGEGSVHAHAGQAMQGVTYRRHSASSQTQYLSDASPKAVASHPPQKHHTVTAAIAMPGMATMQQPGHATFNNFFSAGAVKAVAGHEAMSAVAVAVAAKAGVAPGLGGGGGGHRGRDTSKGTSHERPGTTGGGGGGIGGGGAGGVEKLDRPLVGRYSGSMEGGKLARGVTPPPIDAVAGRNLRAGLGIGLEGDEVSLVVAGGKAASTLHSSRRGIDAQGGSSTGASLDRGVAAKDRRRVGAATMATKQAALRAVKIGGSGS
eukprot:TRINITY_DN51448_c0_g2_i1.p1 TRINITY_DN51448_c0_g2~~TRINITY_DN51448_c0_g2_i1.p1  ORF type:complete len:1370 (-),score=301.74 TRINITY_DN51448_c0_g2_i1:180-4289(-)